LPPLLHFERPNPRIDFAATPFYVNTTRAPWPRVAGRARRAAVNSLGVGGTNAHVIVEEAPPLAPASRSRPCQLLTISARTDTALEAQAARLRRHLEMHPEIDLADAAHTLNVGRRVLEHRRIVVCRDREEAIAMLGGRDASPPIVHGVAARTVAFAIGAIDVHDDATMRELYREEPAFRSAIDRCSRLFGVAGGSEVRDAFAGAPGANPGHAEQAAVARPIAFAWQWGLAALWLRWGIKPDLLLGHGVGELVAACLSGVMSLDDAIGLLLGADRHCTLHPPQLPILSSLTGTWVTAAQATDPRYWSDRRSPPDRLGDALGELLRAPDQAVLEIGPTAAAARLIGQGPPDAQAGPLFCSSLADETDPGAGLRGHLTTLGRLWMLDVPVDWTSFYSGERRRRVGLPGYPFERQRYWIDIRRPTDPAAPERRADIADWFTTASWRRTPTRQVPAVSTSSDCWLLLMDDLDIGQQLAALLERHQQQVVRVSPGTGFSHRGSGGFTVRPSVRADYQALLYDLQRQGRLPRHVVHLWTVGESDRETLDDTLDRGFYSLLALAQALGDFSLGACTLDVVSSSMQEVTGTERLTPAKTAVLGPCRTIPCEYPHITSRSIDIELPVSPSALLGELLSRGDDVVALRGTHRWVPAFEPVSLAADATPFRRAGVYLITGGLGGIALALAERLAASVQARLVLTSRTPLPPRAEWASLRAGDGSEETRRRIRGVQRLESLGAEVLILQADVSDPIAMHRVVLESVERFGAIHGVLHTAGVPGVGLMQLKTAAAAARVLAPKIHGTIALCDALQDRALDFLVLFSSVASAAGGGPGQVDYCAANAFLDAYARRHADSRRRIVSIGWGEWLWDAWQEGLQGFPEHVRQQLIASRQTYGIGFDDGAEALARAIAAGLPHVFVTTRDITRMVVDARQPAGGLVPVETGTGDAVRARHARPNLTSSYIAAGTKSERRIAALWEQWLGLETVGIDDNFFELGGNSLLAVNLVDRIRRDFHLETLPAQLLFECPTVATLARHIEHPDDRPDAADDLDRDTGQRAGQFRHFQEMAITDEAG
jgi:NAD(P)-dependent dehydrogenase (short-subunit alcohol dehydrogenase family)/acyl carrier protein